MEEEQPKLPNKYLEYIKTHKYNIYFIGAIAFLFILIITLIVFTITQSNTNNASSPSQRSNNNSQESSIPSPLSNTPTLPITTPDPTEAVAIENQVQPQITPAISYTFSHITKFGDNWATMVVTNPSTEGGGVIMKKVNGSWKIIEGPGTFFPPQLLEQDGAPQELINSFTNPPSPSASPSPSQSSSSTDIQ